MLPKQKGKRYELITADVYSKLGYKVTKPENTDHDRIINDIKVEVKGSTLNKGKDFFSFLQIRPAQDYAKVAFAMFYPQELVIMELTKDQVKQAIKDGHMKKQHGGNKAESGTFCYYGNRETLAALGAIELK